MKKTILLAVVVIVTTLSGSFTAAQAESKTPTFFAGKINISGVVGNSYDILQLYLAGEGGVGFPSNTNKPFWLVGGYGGPSINISEEFRITLAGGYEHNLTYERGQYAALVGIGGASWSVEATKLWPTESIYRERYNNFIISGMVYPGGSVVGLGAFFQKEYDCTLIGAKLGIRLSSFEGGGGGGGYRTSNNCCW